MTAEQSAGNSHEIVIDYLTAVYSGAGSGFCSEVVPRDVDSSNLHYGEVTYAGMENLYRALRLGRGDVFYDLGSGVGKMVLYVALRGEASRSVGLEVGEKRHRLAETACSCLASKLDLQRKGCTSSLPALAVDCTEFAVLLADITKHRYHDATVVMMANVCIGMGSQNRTMDSLMKCASLKRLVCTTPIEHLRLRLAGTVRVSCTWANVTSWHVYDVLPPHTRKDLLQMKAEWQIAQACRQVSRLTRSSSMPALPRTEILDRLHKGRPIYTNAKEAEPVFAMRVTSGPRLLSVHRGRPTYAKEVDPVWALRSTSQPRLPSVLRVARVGEAMP
mmetsp:Transcript_147622/g.257467  ORF Transcript_147622/g.257467 Transcript_147622/m.257467 type:complete len:332 (+) Transcript_147622:153-1148(+)